MAMAAAARSIMPTKRSVGRPRNTNLETACLTDVNVMRLVVVLLFPFKVTQGDALVRSDSIQDATRFPQQPDAPTMAWYDMPSPYEPFGLSAQSLGSEFDLRIGCKAADPPAGDFISSAGSAFEDI